MRKERRKIGIGRGRGARFMNSLDLPPDALGTSPYITLTGGCFAYVERHKGVLQLSPECVRLYSTCGIIRIEGKNIVAKEMDCERLKLCGNVKSVMFE